MTREELAMITAARVAVAMNGGDWGRDYTTAQKELWQGRVMAMWEGWV